PGLGSGPGDRPGPGASMEATVQRKIDRYFASYSDDHRDPLNQRIHLVAVPAILWSVVALVWCVPSFGSWTRTGIWAALAMLGAWSFYSRLSRPLGRGMLAVCFFCGCVVRLGDVRRLVLLPPALAPPRPGHAGVLLLLRLRVPAGRDTPWAQRAARRRGHGVRGRLDRPVHRPPP